MGGGSLYAREGWSTWSGESLSPPLETTDFFSALAREDEEPDNASVVFLATRVPDSHELIIPKHAIT